VLPSLSVHHNYVNKPKITANQAFTQRRCPDNQVSTIGGRERAATECNVGEMEGQNHCGSALYVHMGSIAKSGSVEVGFWVWVGIWIWLRGL